MFVIAGDMISGEVCSGMYLIGDELGNRFQIHSVEMLRHSADKEDVALAFVYNDESELESLKRIAVTRRVLIFE